MATDDFEERYQKLTGSLRSFATCWNQSILHFWPACRDALPANWWQPAMDWSLKDLHALDNWISSGGAGDEPRLVPEGLRIFMHAVRPCLEFAGINDSQPLPETQTLHMTAKKQHEIAAILPFLTEQKARLGFSRGIDIGGGVGHLARALEKHLQMPMISIDRDAALHERGRAWPGAVEFVTSDVQADEQEIDALFAGPCLSIGLHTCGPLAWTHFQKSRQSQALLNFGCCYDRMNVETDCQRSRFAQQHPLPLTSFALFLATRGRHRTLAELARQEQVNTYRIALHLFMQESGLAAGFVGVGDAPRRSYEQGFAFYATERLEFLGIDAASQSPALQRFLEKDSIQRQMREFFLINIVRNAFSRPLEVLLLLDRALWLAEQGRRPEIRAFFSPHYSPRNLGIFAG